MADPGISNGLIDRSVGIGKDIVNLLRDAALLVLAGLLLLFPATFNDLLVKAGFEEGSIVGFKWKANLIQADEALKNAESTIADLKSQLDKTTKALVEMQGNTDSQLSKSSVLQIQQENSKLVAASAQVTAAVKSSIASNAPLVEKAQTAISSSGGWGVVFGSDLTVDAARDEISRAAKKGLASSGIYLKNGYYVSIAAADSRASAQESLMLAKTFRPDAYITSMSSWCRKPQLRDGFTECSSGQ